jgi:hypothetical protein
VAATEHLHSFRLGGTITDASGTVRVAGMVAGPGRISFSEQRASDVVQVISLGSVTYVNASRAYYSAQPKLTPAQVTRKSGLSVTGTGSVGGRSAVVVASDGSVPGSAPGKVHVAATGPASPLRSVVTGSRKPGGSGACAEPTTPRTSDITISDFNQPNALAAPPSALDLTR